MMQELIEQYQSLQGVVRIIIERVIPDLPGCEEFEFPVRYSELGDSINVEFTLDLAAFRRFRQVLGSAWRADGKGFKRCGRMYNETFFHRATGIRLDVDLYSYVEGSTCRLQKVGVQETPVYDIVCD
jgi:hypothetical protein